MLLCVFFCLTNQVCNYFEFLCKTFFVFENLKGECLKILILEKLDFKLVFWKSISSHTHEFYSLYSMLWGVFFKNQVFFLKCCFFRILIDLIYFFINWNCIYNFLWASICFDQLKLIFNQSKLVNHFFKNFSNLFLSLRLSKALQRFFCRFPPNFLQGFSLPKLVCLYYPYFCIVFFIFMHYLMVFG